MQWLEDLVEFAQFQLDEKVQEALWARGASEQQIEDYRIGYLNDQLPKADYPPGFLEWWGRQPRDDVFVFPLTNTLGHVRGIQLRHVDPGRKGYTDYLATKEEPICFGLAQAMPAVWNTGRVCLVEGNFDLFPIQRQAPYTISTLHAGLPTPLWRVLRRLVRQISLVYDMDSGGKNAAFQITSKYGKHVKVQTIKLPLVPYKNRGRAIKDPGELWEVWGDGPLGVYLRGQLDTYQMET
jgi:DNA primase